MTKKRAFNTGEDIATITSSNSEIDKNKNAITPFNLADKLDLKEDTSEVIDSEEKSDSDGTDGSDIESSVDEYADTDSSDEEDNLHTIGNIPIKWYDDLEHAGYDLDGKQISKAPTVDELDKLVTKMSNPNFWKTIQDPLLGKKHVLTDKEIQFLASLRKSSTVKTSTSMDPHEDFIDFFTFDKMDTALVATNPSKKSFIPSLLDKNKVGH